ncbi:hypothetical protein GCM10029978_115940 [Actinoallomurus acanthiterrae]
MRTPCQVPVLRAARFHTQPAQIRGERQQRAVAGLDGRSGRGITGAETAIAAVRDLATGAALDDAALAAFLDDNGGLL